MKKRILIGMSIVMMITLFLTLILTMFAFYSDSVQNAKDTLRAQAEYLKEPYDKLGNIYLENLDKDIIERITVIQKDGTVIYDTELDCTEMENHANRPEVIEAFKNDDGYSSRMSSSIGEITYYYAMKIDETMLIRVSTTVDAIYIDFFNIIPWTIFIIILVGIITFIIAKFLTRKIVEPLNKINLDNPESTLVYEEISPLINRMSKQNKEIEKNIVELEEQQNEFNSIISHMREGLIIIDEKGNVISFNKSAIKLCSYQKTFQKGNSVYLLNRDLDFYTSVERALKGKGVKYKQKIGNRICRFLINPIENNFNIGGAVIVIMDITETENREEMRREFTANVSHELKTPLTSISGYAEIIKTGIAKEKDIKGFAEKIYSEAHRLIDLVADIIKLSRLDESEGVIQKETCDINQIALDVFERLTPIAENKNIKFNFKGEKAKINGVSIMLEEMLYNLCDNAIKYNKENGSVDLTVSNFGDKVEICVEDTGIGIPSSDTDRIFERFYRVDKSHSKETGGTGLGLSIVKHCVKLHSGKIKLKSTENVGTKITIIF